MQANALSLNVGYLKYLSNKQNNSLAAQAYLYQKGKLCQIISIENSNKLSEQLTTIETTLINTLNTPTPTEKIPQPDI